VFGHIIVPAVTQATHALGCPCTQEMCCSPAAELWAHWEAAMRRTGGPTDVADVAPFTSQASPTWRGLVSQHGTKVTPWQCPTSS
jgi:hypothetical protein